MKMLYIKHRSGKRMNNFAISAILAARELGIDFTIANNMSMADKEHFAQICEQYGINMIHIGFDRNPLGKDNLTAHRELLELIKKERYDIVHCNTPSGGVVGRICASQAKVPKVIYMAHGFHFWKGAPIKNWVFYYPVERILAHYTDRLITINHEDYQAAQRFHYKKGGRAEYVPGVGIDLEKVRAVQCDKVQKKNELGIDESVRIYTTVAELIPRKNYDTLIRAFAKANISNAVLLICGMGEQEKYLKDLAGRLHIENRVIFLGFRTDVYQVLKVSDVFVFPSKQEGLPVALMEAMAVGLPCITSKVRGNVDLMSDSQLSFEVDNVDELCDKLRIIDDQDLVQREIRNNMEILDGFSQKKAVEAMKRIYSELITEIENENASEGYP